MKVSVIGGGSLYVPELVDESIKHVKSGSLNIDTIVLMDVDEKQLKLIGKLTQRMVNHARAPIKITLTTDIKTAIENADFIILEIRVGFLQARIQDEKIALKHHLIAQESTGAAGFSCALRTIPVVLRYAKIIEETAPNTWLINYSNPADIITETISRNSDVKVVGLCYSPTMLKQGIASILNADFDSISLEYFGLNHLGWVRKAYLKGKDVMPKLISESDKMINPTYFPTPIDPKLVRALNMIPNYYLRYYYYTDKLLDQQLKSKKTRGEELLKIQKRVFDWCHNPDNEEKPKFLEKARGSHYWSKALFSLMRAITNDENKILVVNTKNNGSITNIEPESIVEVSSVVNSAGVHPLAIGKIPIETRGLIQTMKAYCSLTINAALEGSYDLALKALMTNPLIPSYDKAEAFLNDILKANKDFLPLFRK